MDRVARPVEPSIREQVGAQLVGDAGVLDTAHVEAREVEPAIGAHERQEARVVTVTHDVHQRRTLAGQPVEPRELRAPGRISRARERDQAVLPDDVDGRPGHRVAGVDRLDEDVLGAVERLLDEDAEIGHEHEPPVAVAPVEPPSAPPGSASVGRSIAGS